MGDCVHRTWAGGSALAAAAALCAGSRAAVINVPGNYPTIQEAILASADGDEIIVAPGTYHEAVDFSGHEVALRSAAGPEATRIDATGLGQSVVSFVNSESPAAVLDGFTITGGTGTIIVDFTFGGGALIQSASPTITNCIFVLNSASFGGGLHSSQLEPTITDCKFIANSASRGGGAEVKFGSVQFLRCVFFGNTTGSIGGGLLTSDASAVVTDCIFGSNTAGAGGGGLAATGPLQVRRCIFTANSGAEGGGLTTLDGYNDVDGLEDVAEVSNCLFADNTFGGGMSRSSGIGTVKNCTFVRNAGYGLRAPSGPATFTTVTVGNCIFRGDQPGAIDDFYPHTTVSVFSSDVEGGWTGQGANNIDADPSFVPGQAGNWTEPPSFDPATGLTTLIDSGASFEPGGLVGEAISPTAALPLKAAVVANTATTISLVGQIWSLIVTAGTGYEVHNSRLLLDSPCIDAGNNSLAAPEPADLDGNRRRAGVTEAPNTGQGDCPLVDMGAYEFQPIVPECLPCPDCALPADGIVDVVDFLALLGAWGNAGPCDFDGNGEINVVDMFTLLGTWGPCP